MPEWVETDEFWSYVGNKKNQRWTWYCLDHPTGQIVAFVLGRRTDATFSRLNKRLKLAGIKVKTWLCDNYGTYQRCLSSAMSIRQATLGGQGVDLAD